MNKNSEDLLLMTAQWAKEPVEFRVVGRGKAIPFTASPEMPESIQASVSGACGMSRTVDSIVDLYGERLQHLDLFASKQASRIAGEIVLVSLPKPADHDEAARQWETVLDAKPQVMTVLKSVFTLKDYALKHSLPDRLQPSKAFRVASAELAREKFAVEVSGLFGEPGVSLTRFGLEEAGRLMKERAARATVNTGETPAATLKVQCQTCLEVLLETTATFNPDDPLAGHMLRTCGIAGPDQGNWSPSFTEDDTGALLTCLSCGNTLVGPDGRIPQERLLPVANG